MDGVLPSLRSDVSIVPGRRQAGGGPSWLLFDPLRNAYFQLTRPWMELLSVWARDPSEVRRAMALRFGREPAENEVAALARFMMANELTVDLPAEGAGSFAARARRGRHGVVGSLVHNYLFFRLPLLRPDRFLARFWPVVRPLFTRGFVTAIAVLGLLALVLLTRQWSALVTQFQDFATFRGLALFAAALVVVKVIHEFGHAFMARRYGLSVPVMGVAFIVLMPILYTDTTHAWRLRSRRQRLLVDGAGIIAELCIAVLATWAWLLMEDGPGRAAVFFLATASWTMSLLINLNPFMRFDGYHILADTLGVENLQSRGFALAKWRLREFLFGLGAPVPEMLPSALHRTLILHAWGTWIYRFFLFLGIAFLVYSFFIKPVAIALFVIEIAWFIAMPIAKEIGVWWSLRRSIAATGRSRLTLVVALGLVLLAFLPLSRTVSVPAVLGVENEAELYPPRAATILALHAERGEAVRAGQLLAVLEDRDLLLERRTTARRLSLIDTRLNRVIADPRERAVLQVLQRERQAQADRLTGLDRQIAQLEVRAPFDGTIVARPPSIHAGRAVGRDTLMFRMHDAGALVVAGMVAERDVERVAAGAIGRFVADDPARAALDVTVERVAQTALSGFEEASLAAPNGGPVAARPGEANEPVPHGSHYSVRMRAAGTAPGAVPHTVRGVATVEAEARSLAGRFARRVVALLVRESGF